MYIPSPDMQKVLADAYASERRGSGRRRFSRRVAERDAA